MFAQSMSRPALIRRGFLLTERWVTGRGWQCWPRPLALRLREPSLHLLHKNDVHLGVQFRPAKLAVEAVSRVLSAQRVNEVVVVRGAALLDPCHDIAQVFVRDGREVWPGCLLNEQCGVGQFFSDARPIAGRLAG